MKTLVLGLLTLSSVAFAGTEIIYTQSVNRGDFSLRANLAVDGSQAKLGLTRRGTGCGFGGVCNFYSKVSIPGLVYNANSETVSFKNTECATVRTQFINHQGRTGTYRNVVNNNGNCVLKVRKTNNQFQVLLDY